jgi:hypothetical protein
VVLLIIPSLDESSNRALSGGLIIKALKILLNMSLIDNSSFEPCLFVRVLSLEGIVGVG